MSGEHFISECLFVEAMLSVEGAAVPIAPRVSRANLKAKVLCDTHNAELSSLDSEAKALSDAIRNSTRSTHPVDLRVRLSGLNLERWCLKALYGALASGWSKPFGPSALFHPDPSMVDIVFGKGGLYGTAGLYVMTESNVRRENDGDQIVARVIKGESEIAGLGISIRGINLLYWLYYSLTPQEFFSKAGAFPDGTNWTNSVFMYRPTNLHIDFSRAEWGSQQSMLSVDFIW